MLANALANARINARINALANARINARINARVRALRTAGDRGSVSLEMLIIGPSLVALFLFVVFVGRSVTSAHAVDEAARAAARAASLAPSSAAAQSAAIAAAHESLDAQDVQCVDVSVSVDAGGIGSRNAGMLASVTVSCTINIADLALPGAGLDLPPSKTFTGSFSSPIDPHRDY